MRGEHQRSHRGRLPRCGSSPHARGTRRRCRRPRPAPRFIPACAGNTTSILSTARASSVHPRMRGEHRRIRGRAGLQYGSSPHARGTRAAGPRRRRIARFIPACAGNTRCSSARAVSLAVHPRMRGEHQLPGSCAMFERGSSPHARGTQKVRSGCRPPARFIPACAGNTHAQANGISRRRGSSPHARGTRCSVASIRSSCAVHPRMRGEHDRGADPADLLRGSSPHARGTLPYGGDAGVRRRFIPACAGNTLNARS